MSSKEIITDDSIIKVRIQRGNSEASILEYELIFTINKDKTPYIIKRRYDMFRKLYESLNSNKNVIMLVQLQEKFFDIFS